MEHVFYNVYHRTFHRYPRSYCFGLEAAVGSDIPPNLASVLEPVEKKRRREAAADYPYGVFALAMPYLWRRPEPSDVLRQALLYAETKFTIEDCVVPSTEPTLNALLPKQLSWAIKLSNRSQVRAGHTASAHAWAVSLDKWRAESTRGGDFVLVFETEDLRDPTKTLVFAACLQAKNADPRRPRNGKMGVDIRRYKSAAKGQPDDGYSQYRALLRTRKLGIPSGYIFFNNSKKDLIKYPILPLVKPIDLFESDLAKTHRTDLARNTITLAGYFCHLFSQVGAIGIPGDDDDRLAALISNATVNKPEQIICLSHTAGFEHRLQRILAEKRDDYQPEMISDPEWDHIDLPKEQSDTPDFKSLF